MWNFIKQIFWWYVWSVESPVSKSMSLRVNRDVKGFDTYMAHSAVINL